MFCAGNIFERDACVNDLDSARLRRFLSKELFGKLAEAPKGRNAIACGSAAGVETISIPQALKGRNRLFRPFRASSLKLTCYPARCAGLLHFAPSGLCKLASKSNYESLQSLMFRDGSPGSVLSRLWASPEQVSGSPEGARCESLRQRRRYQVNRQPPKP